MLLIRVSIVLSLVRIQSPRTEWVFTVIIVVTEEKSLTLLRYFRLSLYGNVRCSIIFHIFSLERILLSSFRMCLLFLNQVRLTELKLTRDQNSLEWSLPEDFEKDKDSHFLQTLNSGFI